MRVEIFRDPQTNAACARFAVADDWTDREVSVVGSFNDWTPGLDVLRPGTSGRREAVVEIPNRATCTSPPGYRRPLVDDPGADLVDQHGCTSSGPSR